jgi:ectoine hydroxylase-related dioxygenase (phytanoyl-CoA dioxygenase family)
MTTADTAPWVAELRTNGYIVVPELIDAPTLAEMRRSLAPHLASEPAGRNNFEGHRTQRIYSLVARGRVFEELVTHPLVLSICDALLEPNYLLTASQAIAIAPGETPQALHYDDGFYSIARPRPAVSISTIWAIDAFTSENGATQIIPGSQLWSQEEVAQLLERIPFATQRDGEPSEEPALPSLEARASDVLMAPGSVLIFLGTLVHRGGGNRSGATRLALSNQYCQPWARPQENYVLSIPRAQARRMSPRLQALLGYSIHPPFMGHAGGVHPRRYLELDEGS